MCIRDRPWAEPTVAGLSGTTEDEQRTLNALPELEPAAVLAPPSPLEAMTDPAIELRAFDEASGPVVPLVPETPSGPAPDGSPDASLPEVEGLGALPELEPMG